MPLRLPVVTVVAFATHLVLLLEQEQCFTLSACMLACRLSYEELCAYLEDAQVGNTFVPTSGANVAITGVPTLFTGRQADAEQHCLLTDFCCSSEQQFAAMTRPGAAYLRNIQLLARGGCEHAS